MSRIAANGSSYEVFENTMVHLEQTLSVEHIATFGFSTCNFRENPRQVLDQYADFDQIPVKRDGKIVGVLERNGQNDEMSMAQVMKPLDVSMLVAAEEPISRFIDCLLEKPYYRLVLDGQHLNGVVTRSDLLKLPVRLLALARITHLELIMAALVDANYPDDTWLSLLPNKRQKYIEDLFNNLQQDNINMYRLEVSGFRDKYAVLSNLPNIPNTFETDMEELQELRNQLAHAKNFVGDERALSRFLGRLRIADELIAELSEIQAAADGNVPKDTQE